MTIQPHRGWQQQPIRQTPSKAKRKMTAKAGGATGATAKAARKKSLKQQRRLLETASTRA